MTTPVPATICETCGHDLESHTRCGCLVIGCQCGRDDCAAPKPSSVIPDWAACVECGAMRKDHGQTCKTAEPVAGVSEARVLDLREWVVRCQNEYTDDDYMDTLAAFDELLALRTQRAADVEEIARLRAEALELRAVAYNDTQGRLIEAYTNEVEALRAELQAQAKDAARYAWLRAGIHYRSTGLYVADGGKDWRSVEGEELDGRIDAALQGQT